MGYLGKNRVKLLLENLYSRGLILKRAFYLIIKVVNDPPEVIVENVDWILMGIEET